MGQAGSIQMSEATYERLKGKYRFDGNRSALIKGRGTETVYSLSDRIEDRAGDLVALAASPAA
jgi:hypothetical protein